VTLDQYEEEMQRVNDEQYENLMLKADEAEEFNELMEQMNREIYEREKLMKQNQESTEDDGEVQEKSTLESMVDNPSHYDFIDTTVEEFIEAGMKHCELMGWFKGNVIKYRMRAFKKGDKGLQDIAKADMYQKFYDDYKARNQP